jgi:HD superfamily phosphodiesterase|tara:strand:+ start:373 stop:603 length:231 start_codon:yes stop_codon:yes gene_type:complete
MSNSPFKMKGFSGFGNSPLHDHERHSEGWVIEHPNQSSAEVERLKLENETTAERKKRIAKENKKIAEKYVTPTGAR